MVERRRRRVSSRRSPRVSENPWFGGGLDGVDQGSPRVARVRIERGPPKVVCLWVLIEWRKPGASLMEWELLGCLGLMAIVGALKTMLHDQCLVTPLGS